MAYLTILFLFLKIHFLSATEWPQAEHLSLEEKVGQLLIVHFHGEMANEQARQLIQDVKVGGIVYYQWANGLASPLQTFHLSTSLQELSKGNPHPIPLWIAVDQEGGTVNRLKKGFTVFPSQYALGRTRQPQWSEACAHAIGEELKAVGVNLNFAPVVDVNSNPNNPVIGIRSFSASPQEVSQFGEYALKGYRKAGVLAVLKHFPGHGDTSIDSHESLPVLPHSPQRLEAVELFPFRQLTSQAEAVMSSHLLVPAWDPTQCVTFSPHAIQHVLRQQLNFEGVVMTDSLVMQGLLESSPSVEEAAIRAVEAGHDIVLLGGKQLLSQQNGLELSVSDIIKIHCALVDAVKTGRLSEDAINASVKRILRLKERYCSDAMTEEQIDTAVHTVAHQQLAQKIADHSVAIASQAIPLPVVFNRLTVIAPASLKDEIELTSLPHLSRRIYFFDASTPDSAFESLDQQGYSLLLFSYKSWKDPHQLKILKKLQEQHAHAIIFVAGDPQDAAYFANAGLVIWTFSPTSVSIQSAINLVRGNPHE